MIILQVGNNGLGNQLYTYALGTVLERIYGEENVSYDVSQLTKYVRGRQMYDIREIMGIQYREAGIREIRMATGMWGYRLPTRWSKRYNDDEAMIAYIQKLWQKRRTNRQSIVIEESKDIKQKTLREIKDIIDENPGCRYYYLVGYWQNMHYILGHEDKIKSRIRFNCISRKCQEYHKMIKESKAVSVHCRRGDFLRQGLGLRFCTCHSNYYWKAFDYINLLGKDIHYYFFSDDIPFVKKQFSTIKNVTFVEGLKDYEDLYLMTQCNINIVSNSTFSFWGGFLNCHEDAIVISPRIQYLQKRNGRWQSTLMSVPDAWLVM